MTTNSTKSDDSVQDKPEDAQLALDSFPNNATANPYPLALWTISNLEAIWAGLQLLANQDRYKLTPQETPPFMPGGMATIDESTLSPDHLAALGMITGKYGQ